MRSSLLMTRLIKDKQESADVLNNDLSLISKWAFNWKMLISLDTNKLAQEVLFSREEKTQNHPNISLNTARKTIFPFSRRPEKMVLLKKSR